VDNATLPWRVFTVTAQLYVFGPTIAQIAVQVDGEIKVSG